MRNEWEPCTFIDYGEDWEGPRYGLMFEEFGDTQNFLEEQGYSGGGYTWHGIVESMMRTQRKNLAGKVEYAPESSMFVARSSDLAALQAALECIRSALHDKNVLVQALMSANKSIIE